MAVRSAREAAYETIRSRIITMELKPGDELNDHELAQELGISRTPMREALIMLNIAHMVTIRPPKIARKSRLKRPERTRISI